MDADAWNTRYAGSDLVWSTTPNQWVESELTDLAPGRAVDLACGEGRNALWLAARGWQVRAVDFAAEGLAKGRAAQARRQSAGERLAIEWVCADAVHEAQPAHSADLVLVCYLQLVPDERRRALRHAATALAPGGTLLVIGHDSTNLSDGYGGPQEPAVLFTARDVVTDLDGLGLVVDRAACVDRVVQTADGPRVAKDALARLHRPA